MNVGINADMMEVIAFIAEKTGTNIHELKGALKRLVAISTLMNERIDLSLAKNVLKDHVFDFLHAPVQILKLIDE